jgi:hypothetical protein
MPRTRHVGNYEWNRQFEIFWCMWKDTIKMDLKEEGSGLS